MKNNEFTDIIYDTLMNNQQYTQLDLDAVDNQDVDANKGIITIEYNGETFIITVTKKS